MADNEGKDERTSRGNEWEVLTLTESTYAAAPGPRDIEVKDGDKENEYTQDEAETGNGYAQNEAETSQALFMSGHFVFPPSQHENLPLEPDLSEIRDEYGAENVVSDVPIEEGVIPSGKDKESLTIKGLNVPEEFAGIQFFDEKINKLSVHGEKIDEGSTLQGFIDKEGSIYDHAKCSPFHNETDFSSTPAYEEDLAASETTEVAVQGSDVSPYISESKNLAEDDKYTPSDLPCGAWWKRRVASLYAHAKEANTFWSVFIAATLMGLVMLGQHWQQERAWQINDEARSRMLSPIFRLKDVLVGGQRRGSLIRGSSSSAS